MTLLVLLFNERWRAMLASTTASGGPACEFGALSEWLTQERPIAARIIVVSWEECGAQGVTALAARTAAPILCLVPDAEAAEAAMVAGAADCEIDPSVARLCARIRVMLAREVALASTRAEAGALRMMTSGANSPWRFWEVNLRTREFTRVLPPDASARRHALGSLQALGWSGLHPESSQATIRKTIREELEHHRLTGELRVRELDLATVNADGSVGSRQVRAQLALDDAGEPTLWRGVTADTTDCVQASASLASMRASFAALLQVLPLAVIASSPTREVTLWNDAAQRMFGYEPGQIVGKNVAILGAEDEASSWLPPSSGGLREQPDVPRERVLRRQDGALVSVWIWTTALFDELGGHAGWVSIVADMTERKRSELDYQQLFRAAHDAIIVFDPADEMVLEVNDRCCEIYRRSREQLVGHSLRELSRDPQRGDEKVRETLASGALLQFETVQYRGDGTPMTLDVNASCVEFRGKRAILSINRDITERLAREEELRQRTRALHEASRLEALGRLAGGVAHDFNNLLMVIESCATTLAGRLGHGVRDEDLVDLEESIVRAKGLIRQLVLFARQAPVEPKTVQLADVTQRLLGLLRRLVGEDVEIKLEVEPNLPWVQIDPSRFEQVLVNLVVNARDAIAGVGTIAITLRTAPGVVEMLVRDTGCGMEEATCSRVFEPFFTTKEPGRGTGLGLATVHGIVTSFGGEVGVTSQLGVGTELSVRLPISDARSNAASEPPVSRDSHPGCESILVVEDEPAVRRFMVRQLTNLGYQVLEGENGRAAFELAARYPGPIDLLLTDIVMPTMGGEELALRLRAVRPDLKCIFISGHDTRGVGGILQHGLGPVLNKPFAIAQLTETVRAVLDAH